MRAQHEEAFRKNSNSVWICGANGFGHAVCRNGSRALEMLERAQRLSPRDPGMFLWLPGGAIVHLLEKRNDEATRWTEDVLRLYPRHLISLLLRAAADMGAGNTSAARQHVERIRGISPTLDVAFASKMLAFQHSDDKELILSALRAAGLPK